MTLEELKNYAVQLRDKKYQISLAEENLKELKKQATHLSEEVIPEGLVELGITSLELDDGAKIGYQTKYYCSLPKEDEEKRDKALQWLRENGHSGIIKEHISVPMSSSEADKMNHIWICAQLSNAGIPFMDLATVHPSTLRAFVKEQMEGGKEFPQDLFGVHTPMVTTVKAGS